MAADGVRLFATAIPLKLMLDISYPTAIIIIAIIALTYTYIGGVKGVIWVDVIQMIIYLGGATIALAFLIWDFLPNGFESVIATSQLENKFESEDIVFIVGPGATLKPFRFAHQSDFFVIPYRPGSNAELLCQLSDLHQFFSFLFHVV